MNEVRSASGEVGVEVESTTGLQPRTAATLSYLAGPFSGGLMLFAETANDDVRFHAWQSIVGLGGIAAAVVLSYVLAFAGLFLSGTMVTAMIGLATALWAVLLVTWGVCMYQAHHGGRWKLPIAGDYAERFTLRRR